MAHIPESGFTASQQSSTRMPVQNSEEENTTQAQSQGGRRGSTSWVWQYFEKKPTADPKKFELICLVCIEKGVTPATFAFTTSQGTGTYARHLKNSHQITKDQPLARGQAQIAGYTTPGAGTFIYNRDRMIDGLAKLVIRDELPFSHGESSNLEEFIQTELNPQFRRVPRNTLKDRMFKAFRKQRIELMQMFQKLDCRVALTCDNWTSIPGEPFICITVHWLNESWILEKRIIAFDIMEERHTGFNIKTRIINTCREFNLDDKIFSVSFDNASANTQAIRGIKNDLPLVLNGIFVHVRCCAHILNLCVQSGLTCLNSLTEPIRKVIKWIRSHRGIRNEFKILCEQAGLNPKKRFCIDTPTRWNSTYEMLVDASKYASPLGILYNSNVELECDMITDAHWYLSDKICNVLQSFDCATSTFSLIYEPNCHLVIQECLKIIFTLINAKNDVPALHDLVNNMLTKWCEYFMEFPYIYGVACVLDPHIKLNGLQVLLEYYYSQLEVEYDISAYIKQIDTYIHELEEIYTTRYFPSTDPPPRPPRSSSSRGVDSFIAGILKKKKPDRETTYSTYSDYLNYDFDIDTDDYNILKWWAKASCKFPVLARVAKDVLAIPASTIASESAFSAGRRILDEKRSRLAPESIKLCVLKKDWDQAEKRCQGLKEDDDDAYDEFFLLETSGSESGSGDEGFNPEFSVPSTHLPYSSASGSGQGPSGSRQDI